MKKIDELMTETSCLSRSENSEPLFVLCARDVLAPEVVREWARRYRARKTRGRNMTVREGNKYREAMELADEMELWQWGRRKESSPTFTGLPGRVAELSERVEKLEAVAHPPARSVVCGEEFDALVARVNRMGVLIELIGE